MLNILLIDGAQQYEPAIRSHVARYESDVMVYGVRDGKSALRYLLEGHKVDIIFSDIDQPSSGGMDIYKRIYVEFPNTKRVIVTSSNCFEMVKYAMNLQINGFLSKPLNYEEVSSLLSILYPEAFGEGMLPSVDALAERDMIGNRRLISRVLAIVEQDVDKDLGLDYIAQKIHISSCYLSALFRESMGQGLISYITEYRLNMAVNLLLKSNLRIFEVAERVGYRSTPYFCTVFKNRYNMTPSEFRDINYRKGHS